MMNFVLSGIASVEAKETIRGAVAANRRHVEYARVSARSARERLVECRGAQSHGRRVEGFQERQPEFVSLLFIFI